jgi:hypothetical protein
MIYWKLNLFENKRLVVSTIFYKAGCVPIKLVKVLGPVNIY